MKRKFGNDCPKLLRIFGKQQELADFPLPGFIVKNFVQLTGELQEISLHYLIRKQNNSLAESLKKFDMEFSRILDNQQPIYNRGNNTAVEDIRQVIHQKILVYEETLKEVFYELSLI